MRTRALVFGSALSLYMVPAGGSPSPPLVPHLLPDLFALPPSGLELIQEGEERWLIFTTLVVNGASGPLEILPREADCNRNGDFDDDRAAFQRVFLDGDEDGVFVRSRDRGYIEQKVGCFQYDPSHRHWHFQDLMVYELAPISVRKNAYVQSKAGFCLLDIIPHDKAVRGWVPEGYYNPPETEDDPLLCLRNTTQGLSAGWGDVYSATRPGQSLDVTGVPVGEYCLSFVVDPGGRLADADQRNNRASVTLRLNGLSVTLLHNHCYI